MAFLESIAKEDLGVFVAGQDFIGTQNMRERLSQTVNYRTAFGSSHPVIRTVTPADSNQVSFSFLLLKSGVQRGLNSYRVLQNIQDFEIQTKKGTLYETYSGCNWTDIDIDSQQDGVTVNVDVTVPASFRNPMEGREVQKDPLERIADAIEKLASDPEVEIEFGPPVCPTCGKMNPVITTPAQGEQSGPMLELITQATCQNCGGQLFIVVESFSVHRELSTVQEEITQRRAGFQNE